MPDLLIAALLGVVQGLTEFLPVSSHAHLVIGQRVLGADPARFGLPFDVAVHLGTLAAVLIYFAGTWIDLLRGLFAGRWRLPLLLAVGTVPAVIAGLALENAEPALRQIPVIVVTLVIGSAIFLLAERFAAQRRDMSSVSGRDAVLIGIAQAIALFPGISRSGITISAGLALGLTRIDATRFSFLLSAPVIAGAAAKTLLDADAAEMLAHPDVVAAGIATSFLSGVAAIAFLMRFLRSRSLGWFVPYRLALAAVLAIAAASGLLR
ncbi:MAG: undecaprenyl-diphosphate phosphatase [Candidatus Limnocylindria bacterium]